MADKDYKAFIVEGEAREPQVIDNISRVFFSHSNFKVITLPAGENIYMLWKRLKADDFDTDIIEVLRESNQEIQNQLTGLSRDDFSEVYLFFDYDAHQTNLGSAYENEDVVGQMLESFDNETENGKLYISYPMVEALRDFQSGSCGLPSSCYVAIGDLVEYKTISASRSLNPHFRDYDIDTWKEIIDVFAMKVSCMLGQAEVVSYEQYLERISPSVIYSAEKNKMIEQRVFILSAFPEFLVDYFGMRLWKKCVKHTRNQLDRLLCN